MKPKTNMSAVLDMARLIHRDPPTMTAAMESLDISRATFFRHVNALREELGMVVELSGDRYAIADYGIINKRRL